MNPLLLVKLSENDKRIIIAIFLVIILIFVLFGLFGSLIIKTMKWQGKKCDALISEVVVNRIVTTPHQLRVYARKKNRRCFLKQAWIPIVIILFGLLLILIHNIAFQTWNYNPFNTDDGFGSLLFVWDFGHMFKKPDDGVGILFLGPQLINSPHFEAKGILSYIAVPAIVIGGVWYVVAAQAYLARTIRAYKLSSSVFSANLDNFNQNPQPVQQEATQENNQ